MPENSKQQQPQDLRASELAAWAGTLCRPPIEKVSLLPVHSDASFRRYFRARELSGIFADMPASENPKAFVAVAGKLQNCGLNIPKILAMNLDRGYFRLKDLGSVPYLGCDQQQKKLYQDAINALVKMQKPSNCENLPRYDRKLLLSEMQLFPDWLLKSWLGLSVDNKLQEKLDALFNMLCESALKQPQVFVHRDYHSRNLMYCLVNNPGILDFQDAVIGPYSYDLVSLLKDCYVRLDKGLYRNLLQHYMVVAGHKGYASQFTRELDFMGVQRHLKAIGIFARLSLRDDKHSYLKEIPRTLSYITELHGAYMELNWFAPWLQEEILPKVEARLKNI